MKSTAVSTAVSQKTLSSVAGSDWQRVKKKKKDRESQREIGRNSNRLLPRGTATRRVQRNILLSQSKVGLGTPMLTKGPFLMAPWLSWFRLQAYEKKRKQNSTIDYKIATDHERSRTSKANWVQNASHEQKLKRASKFSLAPSTMNA
jgi:hypothetical protein